MRPLETLLILANVLTFLVLAVPLPQALSWLRYSAPAALLIAVVQVLVEGPRWQMVPAYAVTGVFFVVWLLQNFAPGVAAGLAAHKVLIGLAVGLGVVALAVSIALPVLLPVFRFPRPGGPYELGTVTYHWVDADRPDVFSADPNARRELMVQIWYPAKADPTSLRAPYVPDADALTSAFVRVQHRPGLLFGNLRYITSDAIPSAPVADDELNYPVLIFLEGSTGFRQMNTFQVEELVSHGYIVAAIDHPYAAAVVVFPGGRQADGLPVQTLQALIRPSYGLGDPVPSLNGKALEGGSIIPYLAQDASFTLDQLTALNQADPYGILTGRLDLERAGAFGMSLGGIVAGEVCRLESRLRACLVMDAPMPTDVVQAGLKQPAMWITRDADTMRLERRRAGGWPEAEIQAHQTSMRAVFESLPGDGYFVQVPGIFHLNFTDVPSWSPLFRLLRLAGPIDVERAHSIINGFSLAFFDRTLKGQPATRFDAPRKEYPEVVFETRRP